LSERIDPLLDCLVELTRLHGRSMTHSSLLAGLPIKDQLTPSLFSRAAARAGFATRIVKMSLKKITAKLLPAILLLKDNRACILISIDHAKKTAKVLLPESGQGEVKMKFEELVADFENRVIFSRPRFRLDHQISDSADIARKGRHWFWSAFFEQKGLYFDVILGALLINVFAVAIPIFTMNVYDRVIPTKAEETLWMLGAGVLAVVYLIIF
jgi:ATP-binding cassette subfamily C protein LapB